MLIAICQSSCTNSFSIKNGVGGFFNGAYVKFNGIRWAEDTVYILYSSNNFEENRLLIDKFNRTNTNVFISGDLSVEDFDTSILPRDPYQFKFIDASPSNIKLEAAPLKVVMKFLGDEFASGSLQIRSITSNQ
jgi:hypothetical protein